MPIQQNPRNFFEETSKNLTKKLKDCKFDENEIKESY